MDNGSKSILKGVAFLASLAIFGVALRYSGLHARLDAEWMEHIILRAGAWDWLAFLAIAGLLTGVGVPRQIVSFAGGYVFGAGAGTILALAGTGLGCALSFTYARLLGRDMVQRRFGRRLRRLASALTTEPFVTTMVIRFIPVGNNLAMNLLAGVLPMPATPFLLGSLVGYAPQTLIFAILGSGVRVDPFWRTLTSLALFGLSSLLGLWLHRRHKAARAMAEEEEAPAGE